MNELHNNNITSFNTITLLILKDHRLERGMTSRQIAESIGISASYWTKIEQGVGIFSMSTFLKAAAALQLSPSAVLRKVERHAALFTGTDNWMVQTQLIDDSCDALAQFAAGYYESPGFTRRKNHLRAHGPTLLSVLESPLTGDDGVFQIADVFRYALDAEFRAEQDTLYLPENTPAPTKQIQPDLLISKDEPTTQTKLIPFISSSNTHLFAPQCLHSDVVVNKQMYRTAPLQFGRSIPLLGISSSKSLLASGAIDWTDSVAPAPALRCFYVQIGEDILKFGAEPTDQAVFSVVQQEKSRILELSYLSLAHRIDKATVCFDGTPFKTLAFLVDTDYAITLAVNMHGTVSTETGECRLDIEKPRFFSLKRNEPGFLSDELDEPRPEYNTLMHAAVEAVAKIEVLGYELDAFRANLNRC